MGERPPVPTYQTTTFWASLCAALKVRPLLLRDKVWCRGVAARYLKVFGTHTLSDHLWISILERIANPELSDILSKDGFFFCVTGQITTVLLLCPAFHPSPSRSKEAFFASRRNAIVHHRGPFQLVATRRFPTPCIGALNREPTQIKDAGPLRTAPNP